MITFQAAFFDFFKSVADLGYKSKFTASQPDSMTAYMCEISCQAVHLLLYPKLDTLLNKSKNAA